MECCTVCSFEARQALNGEKSGAQHRTPRRCRV